MTTPTPAPAMTAKRQQQIRANLRCLNEYAWQEAGSWKAAASELLASHDALTARVAELERERDFLPPSDPSRTQRHD